MSTTLLSIVQGALVTTGGDPVNSIYESPESEDMAHIAKEVFLDISTWDEWPHQFELLTLHPASDPEYAPTAFKIDESYRFIQKVEYLVERGDGHRYFAEMCYLEPNEFLELSDRLLNYSDTKETSGYGINTTFVNVRTDKAPSYYTTFDGVHVVFDSYDASVDTSLQASKLRLMASVIKDFEVEDEFVIPVPDYMLGLYKAEVRIAAAYYLNQQENPLDTKKSLRQLSKLRHYKERVINERDEKYPDGEYGRHGSRPNSTKLGRR